jgi:hypothetical protein
MTHRWTAEPGRHIHFDGQPFVHIDREKEALPVEADALVHFIVKCLNDAGTTPADLYAKQMGVRPHPNAGRDDLRRAPTGKAREDRSERRYSMTFGELPPFKQFSHDVSTRIDPESSDNRVYWPKGTMYPMELTSAREIELAEEFGKFEEFRGQYGKRGFRGNMRQIYDFLVFLVNQPDLYGSDDNEESPGDLASSIMTTLGYEWI